MKAAHPKTHETKDFYAYSIEHALSFDRVLRYLRLSNSAYAYHYVKLHPDLTKILTTLPPNFTVVDPAVTCGRLLRANASLIRLKIGVINNRTENQFNILNLNFCEKLFNTTVG